MHYRAAVGLLKADRAYVALPASEPSVEFAPIDYSENKHNSVLLNHFIHQGEIPHAQTMKHIGLPLDGLAFLPPATSGAD